MLETTGADSVTSETLVAALIVFAVGGYATCFVLLLLKEQGIAWLAGVVAWAANLAVFILNWVHARQPPFGNMYHVQIFLALCFLPLYLILRRRAEHAWLAPHFAVASCLPMIGVLFMERDLLWRRMPALQSPWFVPHVFSYMVSYALLAVAFVAMASGLLLRLWQHDQEFLDRCRKAAYAVTLMAFPLLTFGLLSGALWAEEAWGVYWSWDPKETWSLITWTLYIIYFHARLSPRTRKFEVAAHLLAFAALITTFIFVNILPKFGSGLHSYS